MTINIITRKILLGATLFFPILGMAACSTASTPVAEVPSSVEATVSTETIESTETTEEPVIPSSDLTTVDEEGNTSIDAGALETALSTPPSTNLSDIEVEGLLYMREEEKLARDVYLTLYDQWNINIFKNIAASEQTHTDAVKILLD